MISSLAALSARFSAALLGQKSQDAGIEQKAPLLAHYSAVLQAQLLPTMEIIDVSIIEVLVRVVVSTQDSEAAIHSAITTMVSPTGAEFRPGDLEATGLSEADDHSEKANLSEEGSKTTQKSYIHKGSLAEPLFFDQQLFIMPIISSMQIAESSHDM